ncbi:MAG: DNA cytosine methyltransferase, partial [Mogibacterium sp.]|nr:DNA cytosine methyltransferase [Mogibacterium sp.]
SEGLQGYSAESFRAWQRAAGSAEEGAGEAGTICLNDQGGQRMDVTEDVTSTLRAEAHHPPVVAAGFCTEHSAKAHGIGYEEEKSPTLRTGTVPAAIALDYHPADSRIGVSDDDNMQTLTSRMGTGGNNVPLVMQCFGICSKGSNAMLSENPHSGFYEADTARTLDTNGCNPAVNQGGIAVVEENGSRPSHHGVGYSESDIMYTLNATEQHGVALAELKTLKIRCGRPGGGKDPLVQDNMSATLGCNNDQTLFEPTWSTSKASFFTEAAEEMANTLVATDYKDPPLINDTDGIEYIVRRLTPTECARLQGFPDWWCSDLGTDDPTDEEMEFWTDVFETHSKVVTHASKPKTEKQIRKWLKDPHTDSAAYKMWGNCISLPIGVFVLAGIVWADEKMLVNDAE